MKLKIGDWVRLHPNAEVYLSYKDGSPPKWAIKNEIWVIDEAQELDDTSNLNISTLGSIRINPGLFCSWTTIDNVKEKVRRK